MKIKKIAAITVLLAPLSAFAFSTTPAPAAPTLNDVSSVTALQNYAQSMETWLAQFPGFTDMMNGVWFQSFSEVQSGDTSSQSCNNGTCINSFDTGSASGGFIISTASQSAKQALFTTVLVPAYQLAIQHASIGLSYGFNSYGLQGPSTLCFANNNFAGCSLTK